MNEERILKMGEAQQLEKEIFSKTITAGGLLADLRKIISSALTSDDIINIDLRKAEELVAQLLQVQDEIKKLGEKRVAIKNLYGI